MNLKNIAIAAGAATLALSPAAAFAGNDSARLSAEVNIPHQCSIDGNYHMVLVPNSPQQNNIRRSDTDAINIAQNGSTLWTIDDIRIVSQPVDSVLNHNTGLGVDFRNTGVAPNAMSRIVPPPIAVTLPRTATPKGSILRRPATKTPEIAKMAVPNISII